MTSGDDELQRVTEYLLAARAAGIEPLVTFEHARGAAEICEKRKNRRKRQCRLPSAARYQREFRLFRKRFAFVRSYVPWNEINHFTQPTSRNPKAAAKFTRIVRKNCFGCKVVVADVLDQADHPRAKKPTYRRTLAYIKKYRRALQTPRTICGLHNYSDVNRFRDTGTKKIIKALGCKQIWLTESGGIYKFAGFGTNARRQLKATRYMFKLARRYQADQARLRLHVVRAHDAALRRRARSPTAVRGWPTGRSRSTCRSRTPAPPPEGDYGDPLAGP